MDNDAHRILMGCVWIIGEGGRSLALEADGMKELEMQVRTCQLCRLAKTRTNAVPGEGSVRAEVMFVGEGPGYHEDRQGRPFVGAAGKFLDELLEIAGLERRKVYIANVVKCRPPNNRDPNPDEIAACAPYLERQVAIINPHVIVTLGRYSMARFFPGERISQVHGTARMVDGRMCVAMYHPAAGLHQGSLADVIRSDFRKLPVYIDQARRYTSPPGSDGERRIAEAEGARDEVIEKPETGRVLEADEAGAQAVALHEAPTELSPAAAPPEIQAEVQPEAAASPKPVVEADAAGQPEPATITPEQNGRVKKEKSEEGGEVYKQMSFFE